MDSKQTVIALYGAYSTGDAEKISRLLHDEVVWTAPAGNATQVALGLGRPEDAGPPCGANDLDRNAIVAFMAYNFSRFFGGVENKFRSVVAEGEVVVVEHRLSATLPNGRPYVNDYCFAYEVRDGKVWRIREYMDTRGGWAQVFGEDQPGRMLEFVVG
jgi:ketosteroid isomerase-like protein